MRTLAIGDIHGCFRALQTLAECVPFRVDDQLVFLGDYVDRGPDSRAVLDWLIEWWRKGDVVTLRGNHEIMMLMARDDPSTLRNWLLCGGDAVLASYGTDASEGWEQFIPDRHWQFLDNQLAACFETDSHFFVHANAIADMSLDEQPDYMLYWEPFNFPAPHESGKVMVCGHSSQRSGLPLNHGHAVCIDTRAFGGGWLTCLDVESGRYWQANQQGETRKAWLDDL